MGWESLKEKGRFCFWLSIVVFGQADGGGVWFYCEGLRGVVVVLMWRKWSQAWVTGRW